MKKEFILAFNEVLEEKQLPKEIVIETLEAAMVSAYRKTTNASNAQQVEAKLDLETGALRIFAEKEVVEEVLDDHTEVTLERATEFDAEAELGGLVMVESTPTDFGRVAAQTARQVVQQRIREAERQVQYDHFHGQVGEVVNGVVQAINPRALTLGLDRKAEGSMPRNQQIKGERFRVHDRVRALLMDVKMTPRGPQIILSRAHRNFLRRLLEDEVPEIYHGLVEIRSIAREPGYRSKVAVSALQPGIDPVGACVGVRGVRIQAIVRELHDEKIDVIEWNPDAAAFIAKALSPARVSGVYLDETGDTKTATVVVPEEELSLAIGKDGQNARLGAKLTGWRIDIKSVTETASEALFKLANNEKYAEEAQILAEETPAIEVILAKKQEGRVVSPEEYTRLAKFVKQVETGLEERRAAEEEARLAAEEEFRANIPEIAFELPVADIGLTTRISNLLDGEGFSTIGDVMMQFAIDADVILSINGMGPKTLEDVQEKLTNFQFPEPKPEVVEEEAVAEGEAVETDAGEEVTAEAVEVETDVEVADAEEATVETTVETAVAEDAEAPTDEEIAKAALEAVGEPEQEKLVQEEAGETASFEEMLEEFSGEGDESEEDKKKKTEKSKYRHIEYDPDHDVTIVRRRRKRDSEDGWDEDEW